MNSWLFLFFFLYHVDTISIGIIRNVSLTLITPSFSSIMNGTTQTCLCAMMISSNISAFTYFTNNTCRLFSSLSLTNASFSWTTNTNSLFYFLHLPMEAEVITQKITTGAVLMTTSVSSTERRETTVHLSTRNTITSTVSTNTSPSSTMANVCTTGKRNVDCLSFIGYRLKIASHSISKMMESLSLCILARVCHR